MNLQEKAKWIFDVRFWILILFLVRLENIDLPPLDEHAWRQSITLGVARDYMEVDATFWEPRTINCDSRGGIIAQEFPFFNYCVAGMWTIFGAHNWCFRLFNLLVASLGLYYFSRLSQRLIGSRAALYATVIFGVSVAFVYARKAMPDVFAVSLLLMGVNAGWKYIEKPKVTALLAFFLLTTLGLLCKMPAACVLALLVPTVFHAQVPLVVKGRLMGAGALSVAIMGAWYFIWVPWAERVYGFPLFYPVSLMKGWQELVTVKHYALERFYAIALTSRIAFALCLVGLIMMVVKKQWPLLMSFLASSVVLFFFMLKAGSVFAVHEYYIIPYVPMMSLLAGYGLFTAIRSEYLQMLILIIVVSEAIYRHKPDFFISWEAQRFLKLEKITDQYVPKNAKILVSSVSPTMLYFTHRRGWLMEGPMKDTTWFNGEATVGLHYAVIERIKYQDSLPYPKIFEDNDFRIFKIKKD